jgi:hypothetical protein
MTQQVDFSKKVVHFQTGTGKDAKIFIRVAVNDTDGTKYYNIPILTVNSLQVFSSRPKVPRYTLGSANPKGLSVGIRSVNGFMSATTLNESISSIIRKKIINYEPIEATNLTIDEDGYISLDAVDQLQYLDQLPPCQIIIYVANPATGHTYSKVINGVVFMNEESAVGNSAAFGENYSFIAQSTSELKYEDISKEIITE